MRHYTIVNSNLLTSIREHQYISFLKIFFHLIINKPSTLITQTTFSFFPRSRLPCDPSFSLSFQEKLDGAIAWSPEAINFLIKRLGFAKCAKWQFRAMNMSLGAVNTGSSFIIASIKRDCKTPFVYGPRGEQKKGSRASLARLGRAFVRQTVK